MSDIKGLFNLSNFEEAGENDLLDMSLNESAMTESVNPEAAKKADDALRGEMNELTGLIGDLRKLAEDEKMDENLKKILKAKIEFLDTKRMNILKACQNSIKESVEVTESTEIQDKCPSCNPEVDFDPSTKENNSIAVPGGDKEQPSTSVKEQEIAVPGGDKEQPSSKPAGQTIPAANKVLLDSDTYNAALDQLQKSFKEAVDVLQTFKEAKIVDDDPEMMDLFNFTESTENDLCRIQKDFHNLYKKGIEMKRKSNGKITDELKDLDSKARYKLQDMRDLMDKAGVKRKVNELEKAATDMAPAEFKTWAKEKLGKEKED